MKLNPGDCVYYGEHRALGFLIRRFTPKDDHRVHWEYALRSPQRDDWSNIIVSIQTSPEAYFIQGFEDKRLNLYRARL